MGATADTKRKGPFTWMERRQTREINKTDDIAGCAASTVQKGPDTKRCLNPLSPEYVIPGCKEQPVNSVNDPYGMKTSSMGFNNFKVASEQGVDNMRKTFMSEHSKSG